MPGPAERELLARRAATATETARKPGQAAAAASGAVHAQAAGDEHVWSSFPPTGRSRSSAVFAPPLPASSERRGAIIGGQSQPASSLAQDQARPAAGGAPMPDRISGNLKEKGEYGTIYGWLQGQSVADEKGALFAFFDRLQPLQKMAAIRSMNGGTTRQPDLAKVKANMLTGIFTKNVDWDKFSQISRESTSVDMTNYNDDQARDYVSYAAIGSSALTGGTSGSATVSAGAGASGATSVAEALGPAAAGLSGIAAVSQIYNASQNYDDSLDTADKVQLLAGEATGGAADLARFSAGGVNSVRIFSGMAAQGAATVATGAGAVVGGAAYMVGGVAGYRASKRNEAKLSELEEEFNEREGEEGVEDLANAANLGGSTQGMNKTKSAMTAAKGALMVAGGVALIAAAASPVGPILIAAAAILGGVAAIIKFYKKHKRKETFVDKVLKIDEEMRKPANEGIERGKVRQAKIESYGFNTVAQCYAAMVTHLAEMLYKSGVIGNNKDSIAVIDSIGLKVDKKTKKPTKEMIAKKLHT